MEVKEQTLYSRLFGGVFDRIEEYGGDVSSPMHVRATKMLDTFLEKLDKSVLEDELVNWIDSDALDALRTSDPFLRLCAGGHLELTKWISEKESMVQKLKVWYVEKAFCEACKNGHVHIAEWLVETFPAFNTRAERDFPFLLACVGEHTELIEWFQRRYKDLPNFQLLVREVKQSGMSDKHFRRFFERVGTNVVELFEMSPEENQQLYQTVIKLFEEEEENEEKKRQWDTEVKTGILALTIEQEEKSYGIEMSQESKEKFEELQEYVRTHNEGFYEKLTEYCRYMETLRAKNVKVENARCCVVM
jgi:hypothetical protein